MPSEFAAPRVLRLPEERVKHMHPAIAGLTTLAPPPGGKFPLRDRLAWPRAMATVFQLVYGFEGEIVIELSRNTEGSINVWGEAS